jgi:FtsH-binding integral membrane protein
VIADLPLRERERELAAVEDVLGRTGRGGSGLVLVEGPAGIGKSRLVEELVARAEPAGVRVLVAHGAHLEREFEAQPRRPGPVGGLPGVRRVATRAPTRDPPGATRPATGECWPMTIVDPQDPTAPGAGAGVGALSRDRSRELLGQVMGLVGLTVGCTALGAYVGRDLSGGAGLLFFIAAFGCIIGLNIAASRGREQLAIGLLFGLGLALGLAIAPTIKVYADADPAALWQAAGVTALVITGCGAYGYATRRDLSSWGRTLFWALLALIVFGIVTVFVSIPNGNVIYAVAGIGIFGAFTIFDFNRLRRANPDAAVPIAAGIFLDIFNVFLLALNLFGGGQRD